MDRAPGRSSNADRIAWALALLVCVVHGVGVWLGMGGWSSLTSPWPMPSDDHPMHLHSAVALRGTLWKQGFSATYDPSFMAGYPLSVVSDQSGTPYQLAVSLFGFNRPAVAYKACVFLFTSLGPFLVLLAVRACGGRGEAAFMAVLLDVLYLWTDFPINYARFGMMTYLLGVPVALVATMSACSFLDEGGGRRWLSAAALIALTMFTHLLTLMVLVPAVLLAYLGRCTRRDQGFPLSRHLGVWSWAIVGPLVNAWWLWPWWALANTQDAVAPAFFNSDESVLGRLAKIVLVDPPILAVLWAAFLPGLVALTARAPTKGLGLIGFLSAGLGWGYLAAASPSLDFLQPGRHTYALYTGACLAAGLSWATVADLLRAERKGLDWLLAFGLLVMGLRIFTMPVRETVRTKLDTEKPFLMSEPTPRLRWLVDRVKQHFRSGDRVFYEEGGKARPGLPDVFGSHRYGGLLPFLTGVEVIGGPFLHVLVKANHVQFGEGKLIGRDNWTRADFVELAAIYRPQGIICWSPRARAFCRENPDLVEVLEDEELQLIGRVKGFEGAAISGKATVRAEPGRLVIEDAQPGLDGQVVLRYHFDPHLKSVPPVRMGPRPQGRDPVPMIGFEPGPERTEIVLDLRP